VYAFFASQSVDGKSQMSRAFMARFVFLPFLPSQNEPHTEQYMQFYSWRLVS
jgi:hypothetical protein